MRRLAFWAAGVAALLVVGLGLNTLRNWAALTPRDDAPAARLAALAPYWRMLPDDAPVASAGAILLSGCDGVRDNMAYWAQVMVAQGRPALIVDSHVPRDFDDLEIWRLVCAGQVLPGAERAGDLAVAMGESDAPAVALLGASHGGWTVLEFLRLALTAEVPVGLTGWPAAPGSLLSRVDRVVVLYPYCGLLNRADAGDWSRAPPMLMILAERDEIVSTPACEALAERLRERGARIELHVLPDAGHGFDQRQRAAFSTLSFDAELREETRRIVTRFLSDPEPAGRD